MDTAYYVMHPTLGLTAVVHAPATEKARTTFLDWLERHGHIRRADRQSFRQNMVAERLEDPNVPADVVLHYGYEDTSSVGYRLGGEPSTMGDLEEQGMRGFQGQTYEPSFEDYANMEEGEHPSVPVPQPAGTPKPKLMPVQKVMLGGYTE